MIRNTMLLIAMAVGMVGIFAGDPRFFFAGGLIALTTLFLRFKSEPPRPREQSTPLEILETELQNLDSEMSNMSIMDDNDKECYIAVNEKRAKLHEALVEIIKAQK